MYIPTYVTYIIGLDLGLLFGNLIPSNMFAYTYFLCNRTKHRPFWDIVSWVISLQYQTCLPWCGPLFSLFLFDRTTICICRLFQRGYTCLTVLVNPGTHIDWLEMFWSRSTIIAIKVKHHYLHGWYLFGNLLLFRLMIILFWYVIIIHWRIALCSIGA